MINAEKLTFGFSSTLLFQNISFTLEENRHCVLIGSNGTGKTTLVNLIREPEKFIFDGKLTREGAGRIGYVSQFALREGDQSVTVFDYRCQDFLELEKAINDICDEMGILVWQEFMLACNDYPDEKHYLEVLEKEGKSIIKSIKRHPSLALWCGGNELFNSWSGMDEQSLALRLLNKLCYEYDRDHPYLITI